MDHFIICFLICKFEQYLMQVSLFHLFFFHRELRGGKKTKTKKNKLCVLSPLDYLRTLYIFPRTQYF